MDRDQPAGASLRNGRFRAHHPHRLPLHLRAYHFFVTTACNARLSSSSSATACFSCRFSSSSCRNRRASLTSIPPYFAFQRYRLPRVIPCRRHSSSGAIPASASFRMAMICSSLKRLLRTTPPLGPERAIVNGEVTFPLDYFSGGRSRPSKKIGTGEVMELTSRGTESGAIN